jgi:hypothetical protein
VLGQIRSSKARGQLSEGMQISSVCYTEMVEQLIVFRAAVSSAAQSVLRRSPTEAFWVDVVDEQLTEFQN